MEPFLAMIMLWPCNFAPRGWAFCDGSILSIAQNTALFSLLGTTYGGNGQTTFALPDLRGRVPVGAGAGPALSSYVLGQSGGLENIVLLINQMPSHLHTASLTVTVSASNQQATNTTPTANNSLAAVYDPSDGNAIAGYNTTAPNTVLNMAGTAAGSTGLAGGNQAHSNIQPYMAVNYVIALEGIFPSRS